MRITYDAFDKTGIAETYLINVTSLQDSSKDYLGDLDYIGDSFEEVYEAFVKRNKLK